MDIQSQGCSLESVKVTDEPSIAIKPCVVDDHIEHKEAYCFKVENSFGYGLYNVDLINECEIICENLEWKEK